MDVKERVKIIKLMGDLLANPDKFKDDLQVLSTKDDGDYYFIALKLGGGIAGLVRGLNVERPVEKQAEENKSKR